MSAVLMLKYVYAKEIKWSANSVHPAAQAAHAPSPVPSGSPTWISISAFFYKTWRTYHLAAIPVKTGETGVFEVQTEHVSL